jgi:hypothetical protein
MKAKRIGSRRRAACLMALLIGAAAAMLLLIPGSVRPAQARVPASGDPPLARDVQSNLASDYSITTKAPRPGTSAGIAAAQARATAANEEGSGGTVESAHLVLYSDPEFGEAASEEAAGEDDAVFTPLYMNHLAWLVVIRNASELVSIPGRSSTTYSVTRAVFIDASSGRELTSVTLPP